MSRRDCAAAAESSRDVVLMLWAHLDETGIHDKDTGHYKHLAIGGAIAELDDWRVLERRWTEALQDEQLTAFHMAHFEASTYEFEGWDDARHKIFLNRLLDIIWQSNIRACFGAGTLAPENQKGRKWFPAVYKRCVERLITDILWQADYLNSPERDIRAVFAKHQEINYPALVHYYEAISRALPRNILISTDLPVRSPGLQVADLVIYETARWLYDQSHPVVPSRYPLQRLYKQGMSVVLKVAPEPS